MANLLSWDSPTTDTDPPLSLPFLVASSDGVVDLCHAQFEGDEEIEIPVNERAMVCVYLLSVHPSLTVWLLATSRASSCSWASGYSEQRNVLTICFLLLPEFS